MILNQQKKQTILLVEDNPHDEMLALRALGKNKQTSNVYVVRDGAEALDYLFATGEYVDRDILDQPKVVFLDLKLPKIDGLEVLRRIKSDERTKKTVVVIFSSSDDAGDMATGYSLKVNSFVRKPVSFAEYVKVVNHLGLYWLTINKVALEVA